jgi:hypothetical protein
MELIAAILLAGTLGYFTSTRKRGLGLYLLIWAIIFPIQTIVVFSASDDGNDFLYWVVNAVILCGGIGLNTAGARLRQRRTAHGLLHEGRA